MEETSKLRYFLKKRGKEKGFRSFEDYLAKQAYESVEVLTLVVNKLFPNMTHNINENRLDPIQLDIMISALERLKAIKGDSESKEVVAEYRVESADTPTGTGGITKQVTVPPSGILNPE